MKKTKLRGKAYDNKFVTLLSILLRNAKWIMLFTLIANALAYMDQATSSYGLGGEYYFWGFIMALVTVLLFVFNKTWIAISDKITDMIASMMGQKQLG